MGRRGSGVEMGSGVDVEEVEAASRGVEAITDSALRRGLVAFTVLGDEFIEDAIIACLLARRTDP